MRLAVPRGGGPDVELCPLVGSPPALVDAADGAIRAAVRLTDSRTQLLRVRAALDGQRSAAVDRARERLTMAADDARASGGMLEAAAATLRRHASALREVQAAAASALTDRAEAVAREVRWQAEADEARRSTWNVALAGGAATASAPGTAWSGVAWSGVAWPGAATLPGDPGHAHLRLAAAERELAAARADVAAAEARWRAARDGKDEASRQAAAALASLADVRAMRAVAAAGADPTGLEASGTAARHAVALLPRAASGGDEATRRELRADVRRLLTARAGDPAFWAVFWDRATPEDLYLAIGPSYLDPSPPVPPELQAALRQGAEDWARTASDPELREYGREVVTGVGSWPLGLSERSWLAAALLPADLPAAAHAAAGDALDARWWARTDEEANGDGPEVAPGRAGDALTDATITAPLAAAVLAGYARHPRLALDRLAPTADDQVARSTRRWFGWVPRGGWPDDGRAAAGALVAAVEEGTASPDRADQQCAAVLVSHATPAMASGLLSGPTLDDRASADVARAYEAYLPSVGDATREQSSAGGSAQPVPAPGIDPDDSLAAGTGRRTEVPQPELDAFALRDVIAATSRSPEAAQAWLGTTERYAASMAEVATSGVYDVDTAPRYHLVEQTLGGVGAVTGAMQAETLAAAYDEVETRAAVISLTGDAMGLGTLGRSTVEAVAATAATKGMEFLDTDGPIAEVQDEVGAVGAQTYVRYATTMHDLVLAHDLDVGLPLDEAMRRAEGMDAATSVPLATQFRSSFDDMSRPSEGDR
ncbi:hypothetical protein [Krasilnikoviella flava]|uniref:Uncharacterized protein n=1 Tax=Krasilnikoviella flava TaxID=526729 RepID=A0A1T5LZ53_9MICO|nr:hypothetical protein [Krasilnikoviella flava]SKC81153.1 hypothetical protein SAMN04324258_4171 [Krasilnikoviella flava]